MVVHHYIVLKMGNFEMTTSIYKIVAGLDDEVYKPCQFA
jgi:hypothetical protein